MSLKWQICWSSVAGCHESPHSKRYRLRCHFYKRIQHGTFVVVENQSNGLDSYLVTASKEYEEEYEEYEENENGRFGSRNAFACLQGQFTVWVFYI